MRLINYFSPIFVLLINKHVNMYNYPQSNGLVENQAVKSSKEAFVNRMKSKNPDFNMDDEEAVYGIIMKDYGDYDGRIKEMEEREKKLSDLMQQNPAARDFILEWANGADPYVSLIRRFGDKIMEAMDDPEKAEEIAEANKDFLERAAKSKEYEDAYTTNMVQTLEVLGNFQDAEGYSDDEMDEGIQRLCDITADYLQGKILPETLKLVFKANNYDADVADAQRKGEVSGRNQRIKEQLRKPQGDGIANLTTKAAPADTEADELNYGAIGRYGMGASTIADRGGMRRIKHNQ